VEKYGRVRWATGENIMLSMCFARRITKAKIQTHTHSVENILLFHYNTVNAPHYYVISTLPVLLIFISSFNGDRLFRVQIG
jgi:hypothetical protein